MTRSTTTVALFVALQATSSLSFAPATTLMTTPPRISSTELNAVSLNVASAMTAIDSFWQTSPYTAAALICGFKASAADMVAQQNYNVNDDDDAQLEEGDTLAERVDLTKTMECVLPVEETNNDFLSSILLETDYRRNVAFLLYGSLYQGISQEYIYNTLYPSWFGPGNEVTVVLTKVAFDLLVQTPLLTLPMAYLIKGTIFAQSPQESISKYIDDIAHQSLLQKYWLLWGPVGCFTFGVVPEHYRVTFIACVSFFWLIILSNISSASNQQQQEQPQQKA
ncbi:Mpv17 / PMP22 family [Seminavis robusta]|uniref:Mpv17 / PMP22 family n=1 Tax=Seminavis robusta TaxID=568900 RepID=A0A9N8EAL2_9STRA|nr:Mpv17 / PMP22 family [Seminavis robusta]|eukprot:Sro812_g206060.1 Mpv17 / PMP22 family (280) ;mRNA; r:21134-21973